METFLKVIEGSALTTSTKQTRLYEHIADKGGLISIVIYTGSTMSKCTK